MSQPDAVARLSTARAEATTRATGRWAQLRQRHRWLRHVLAAVQLIKRSKANQYAAAITYFSFLALFPLLLVAVSVTGFVLHSHPAAEHTVFTHITNSVPGDLGAKLRSSLQRAVDARAGLGVAGLVGVLFTGLAWIANLRGGINTIWGDSSNGRNAVVSRLADLAVLITLVLGIIASLAVTLIGTEVTDQVLRSTSLRSVPESHYLLKVVSAVTGVLGDMVILWWLLIRLPRRSGARVARRPALTGLLMAAVGFEILEAFGEYTIKRSTAGTTTAGPFAATVAILVWIQLVARWVLFCCAWLATARARPVTAAQRRPRPRRAAVLTQNPGTTRAKSRRASRVVTAAQPG